MISITENGELYLPGAVRTANDIMRQNFRLDTQVPLHFRARLHPDIMQRSLLRSQQTQKHPGSRNSSSHSHNRRLSARSPTATSSSRSAVGVSIKQHEPSGCCTKDLASSSPYDRMRAIPSGEAIYPRHYSQQHSTRQCRCVPSGA